MTQGAKNRQYVFELTGAMLLYAVVLIAALHTAPRVKPAVLKTLVSVSPMLPIGLAIWAISRHCRRIDEYVRRMTLENIAVAAAATAGASMTYGFLEIAFFPKLSMFVVWPVMGATWGAVSLVRGLRNR